jgi:uncharacterized cofD-like protein
MKMITTIGGGTGTYTVLIGLKKYAVDLMAIVSVTDSGGSTGRLRDEFGYLPVGDFRMALVALSSGNQEEDMILRKLFMYRFDKRSTGLKGHNFGNLFLVALTDILGDEEKAIKEASRILRAMGTVIPVTTKNTQLGARYENGEVILGETHIDEPEKDFDGTMRIKSLFLKPRARITEAARLAITASNLVVLGPGDLFTSTLANIVVAGCARALQETRAKIIYVVNLISKYGQTYKFTAMDHVLIVTKYIGRPPDYVLVNSTPLPPDILKRYARERGFPVKDDLGGGGGYFTVIREDLLASEEIKKPEGDVLQRSLIRHDSEKLAKEIIRIL